MIVEDSSTDTLRTIHWNSNSWDLTKAMKIANLANTEKADVVMITDTRIDNLRVGITC